MLVVAPPINESFQEHMALCLVLRIPFFFVVTKTDLGFYNPQETLMQLQDAVCAQGCTKNLVFFDNNNDEYNVNNSDIIPVFMVSCVTGEGLVDLTRFIQNLSPLESTSDVVNSDSCLFQIDETFK